MNSIISALFIWMAQTTSAPLFASDAANSQPEKPVEGTREWVAHVARRSEAKGDFAAAILTYNQLLKRDPNNAYLLKRIMYCQKKLEKNPQYAAQTPASGENENPEFAPLPDVSGEQLTESTPAAKNSPHPSEPSAKN